MKSQSIFFYLCIFFPLLLNTGYSQTINQCDYNCGNNGICQNNSCICTPLYYGVLCQYKKNVNNNTNNTNTNNTDINNNTIIHHDSLFTLDTTLIVIFSLSGVILFILSIILFLHVHRLLKRRKYKRMKTISIPTIRTWARE